MINETHQRQININNDWYINGIEIVNIKKGYYCDFNDDTFETDDWKLQKISEEKEYMHYFNFDRNFIFSSKDDEMNTFEEKIFYRDSSKGITNRQSELEGVIEKLAWSLNNQGAPSEITIGEYNSILTHLGLLR